MLIESIDTQIDGQKVLTKSGVKVKSQTLAVVNVPINLRAAQEGHIYGVQPSQAYIDEH